MRTRRTTTSVSGVGSPGGVASEGYVPPLASGVAIVWVLVALALFVPWFSVSWRRYQDVNLPGVISIVGIFVPIVTLIVGLLEGTSGDNPYGSDPKAID